MKLYDGGRAPNPRRVRIFLAEKGITVATGTGRARATGSSAAKPMPRSIRCSGCRHWCSTTAR